MKAENNKGDYRVELEKNGVLAFVPIGNSMWPTLKNRKQTIIVAKKTQKLKHFDVALFQRENGEYILHRVMQTTDDGYITCGDSQFRLETVLESAVIGVMMGFYRGKKFIDVNDEEYLKEVKKWYANEKRRKKKTYKFYTRQRIRYRIKYIIKRLLGKKDV